jgi:hypothetical protein
MLPDTPACSQLSLFHDSALPVNWIHQVRTDSEEASAMERAAETGVGRAAVPGGGR